MKSTLVCIDLRYPYSITIPTQGLLTQDDNEDIYNYSHIPGDPVFSSYSYSMRYLNADTDNNGYISMDEAFSYALDHDSSYNHFIYNEETHEWMHQPYEVPQYTYNGSGIYL